MKNLHLIKPDLTDIDIANIWYHHRSGFIYFDFTYFGDDRIMMYRDENNKNFYDICSIDHTTEWVYSKKPKTFLQYITYIK